MIFNLDKRGQIGKVISWIPVMFYLFILSGAFLLIASGMSLVKGGNSATIEGIDSIKSMDSPLSDKLVDLDVVDKKSFVSVLVEDYHERRISNNIVSLTLGEKAIVINGCVALKINTDIILNPSEFLLVYVDSGKTTSRVEDMSKYEGKFERFNLEINERMISYDYYEGECLQ